MRVSLIVAMTADRVIGRDGRLPWHIPSDLRHFKALTLGKPVIMGRRTFESIGRALAGRPNIVVTRDRGFRAAGIAVAHGLADALTMARGMSAGDDGEAMVIGGAEIFADALPRADRLYLTEVHRAVAGDTFFPDYDRAEWAEVAREDHPGDDAEPGYSFVVLERRARAGPPERPSDKVTP